jgi:xanthine dehydrogenase small subunit
VIVPKPAPAASSTSPSSPSASTRTSRPSAPGISIGVADGRSPTPASPSAAWPRRQARARPARRRSTGQPWTRATVEAAAEALGQDFTPITDMRASAAYRLDAARNVLIRAYLEAAEAGGGVREAQAVAYG